jgi:hypothetical protein
MRRLFLGLFGRRLPFRVTSPDRFIEKCLDHISSIAILTGGQIVDFFYQFVFKAEATLHFHTPILLRIALFDNNILRKSSNVKRSHITIDNVIQWDIFYVIRIKEDSDMNPTQPVYILTYRDKVVRYLDENIRAQQLLAMRLPRGPSSAYVQLVRDACPDCPRFFEDDVADRVHSALKARLPRVARRVRRGRAA